MLRRSRIFGSIRRARGASTTEALFVVVFGLLIAGAGVAVLAPGLTASVAESLAPLGFKLPGNPARGDSGAGWYVVFTLLGVGFFAFLVAPLLFPKARSKRESVISDMTGTFSVLKVFTDQDKRADRGLAELRDLNDEVKRMQGTPASGLAAARSEAPEGIALDAAGVGASEEPTVQRKRPVTGKEQAIADLPQLQPLGAGPSDDPTQSVQAPSMPESADRAASSPGPSPEKGLVIRRLDGVRAADYRSPEPVASDEDATLVRADRPGVPLFDDPDDPTNVVPGKQLDRAGLLTRAAEFNSGQDVAGPEDPTQMSTALEEDLRTTIQQEAQDPAGPDATTSNYRSPEE